MITELKNKEFWKSLSTKKEYQSLVQLTLDTYSNYEKNIPDILYSQRYIFYKTGDRSSFEKPYFARRDILSTSALLCLLFPENEEYLEVLHNVMWAIIQEYSWCLPAHCCDEFHDEMTTVDLFSSETASSLMEICYALEDRLDLHIVNQAKREVKRRIIDSMEERTFWWEQKNTNNWGAVCAGNVGKAMLYYDNNVFEEFLPRFITALEHFLESFSSDGTCLEGISYWHYGYGNYVWFADILSKYSNGKINLLSGERIEKISSYLERTFLKGNIPVSFSDSSRTVKGSTALLHYLHKNVKNVNLIPDSCLDFHTGNNFWANISRAFLYYDPSLKCEKSECRDYFLDGAQQVIINREKYSLAVKLGSNYEPHNHNDVGSFILTTDDGQIFADIGTGLYSKQYFSKERYSIFCNSSFGHSVPIINGKPQSEGPEYRGKLFYENNTIKTNLTDAYRLPELKNFERTYTYHDDKIEIRDSFDVDGVLTDRFISLIKPEISGNTVKIATVTMTVYDADITIKTEIHEKHGYKNETEEVYCIDLAPHNKNEINILISIG